MAMYEVVNQPPSGVEAFQRSDDAAVLTQAAVLLVMGLQMQGSDVASEDPRRRSSSEHREVDAQRTGYRSFERPL
jgi:hypothetical protein